MQSEVLEVILILQRLEHFTFKFILKIYFAFRAVGKAQPYRVSTDITSFDNSGKHRATPGVDARQRFARASQGPSVQQLFAV